MKRVLGLSVFVLLLARLPAHAQGIPVFDATNLLQNVVTAVQTVFIVANQVLELTGLDEIVLGDEFSGDLEQISTIAQEAQGLSYDVASLQAQITVLFDLGTAPASTGALQERLTAIRQVVFESYVYALRTQTLLRTSISAINHLTRLVSAIEGFVGNMQGNQTMAQLQGNLNKTLTQLEVQTAAYQRAQSVERLSEALTLESINRINEALMEDYPK
jgi:conjugal transfer/entry exclusion protein